MRKKTFTQHLLIKGGFVVLISLLTSICWASENEAVSYEVLENTRYDGCPFSGQVALSVQYTFDSAEFAQLTLSGVSQYGHKLLAQKEVEQGRGSDVFVFTLDDCMDDIQVQLNPI